MGSFSVREISLSLENNGDKVIIIVWALQISWTADNRSIHYWHATLISPGVYWHNFSQNKTYDIAHATYIDIRRKKAKLIWREVSNKAILLLFGAIDWTNKFKINRLKMLQKTSLDLNEIEKINKH